MNESCDVGEYLDYENCKHRKKLVEKLVERSSAEECTKNIDEVKIADENECVCSCTICVVLAGNGKSQTNKDQKSDLLFLQ